MTNLTARGTGRRTASGTAHRTARRLRPLWISVRLMLIFTAVLGIAYPLIITGIGQLAFHAQANGSLVRASGSGVVVGSALIGQSFADAQGAPLPQYFQPRPSAAGADESPGDTPYDAMASAGSNLGPENGKLIRQIAKRRAQIAAFNGIEPSKVPVDALTASGSGLDPNISPAYARLQASRVASERGLPLAEVEALIERSTSGRDLGVLGEARVNVVELNLALDQAR